MLDHDSDDPVFRDEVRAFAQREIAPKIRELDAEERFDPAILRAMAEAGLLGLCIPRALGGRGLDYHHLGIACEELERVDTFARVILSVHLSLNCLALYQWGTADQWERWLGPQARGEKVAAFALTEPDAGTDAAAIASRAEKVPGGYRLTGHKEWIGLADVADQFLLFAVLQDGSPEPGGPPAQEAAMGTRAAEPTPGRRRAVTAFLARRGTEGLWTDTITGKHGIRAGNVGRVHLDGVFVPEEDRLGEEGEGFAVAMSALDNGRFSVAAGSVGVIQACLDSCVPRCRERRSFGTEIGRHQLVQQMLARMVAARDVGRLLVGQVAEMKCRGVRHSREVSLAKWVNCDAAYQSANDAVQIFGAHGYSSEQPVERHLRNCRAAVIYEGTREIHQVIQAEYLLGYRYDRPLRRSLPPYPFPEDTEGSGPGVDAAPPSSVPGRMSRGQQARLRRLKLLDPDALIDGRVLEMARGGLLEGTLYIPEFVVDELRLLAGSGESVKRNRASRGLNIVEWLREEMGAAVGEYDDLLPADEPESTHSLLLRLAREVDGTIVTVDLNLTRMAQLEQVRVLNIGLLASTLSPVILPGDSLSVRVFEEGKEPGQGIGYLDDRTTVVVENASARLGEIVTAAVTSVLQTKSGRIIFCAVDGPEQ